MRMLTAYSTLVSSPVGDCTCICTALQVDALVRTEELRSLAPPPEAGRLYQLGSDDNDPVAKQCQVVESKA